MQLNYLDILVVIVYFVAIVWLGVYQGRKIKTSGDYFAGGRGFNKFLMMMHSLGTGTHADDPVGVIGASFQRGLSGIWYTFVYLFVTPFYWIIAPVFRRARFLTTSDFFEARFGSGMGLLYAIMGVLTFTINIGTMLKGAGVLVAAITNGAVPEWVAIMMMATVFVIYGTVGGLIATVVTEAVQGLLIVVMSLLLVPFGLAKIGGFAGLHSVLDPGKFNLATPAELSIAWIIGATIANLIGIVSQPHTMEVCATGKTEWEGRVGFTYGSLIKRFCAVGWALTGVIVLAMVTKGMIPPIGHREEAFGVGIRVLLPPGLTGLMFVAILAAQMSTLSAFMVASSAMLSRNIYRRYINPAASDARVVMVARYAGLITVALGLGFAFVVSGVADALTIFWAVTTFTGVFMWFGVLWRRTNATGAWLSFVTMVVLWCVFGPVGAMVHQVLPGVQWLGIYGEKSQLHLLLLTYLPAGVFMLVIGSLFGKRVSEAVLNKFYLLLKTPVGEEEKLIEAGVDVVYAGQAKGHPWEMRHSKLVSVVGFFIALALSASFLLLLRIIAGLR